MLLSHVWPMGTFEAGGNRVILFKECLNVYDYRDMSLVTFYVSLELCSLRGMDGFKFSNVQVARISGFHNCESLKRNKNIKTKIM